MGIRQAPDPNQQPQQAAPTPTQAPPNQPQQAAPKQAPPLNQNQQKAATSAMGSIKTEFNKAMQNLLNSGDPATQKLAKQFVDKINQYMDKIQVKNGGAAQQPAVQPTVGTSMPQQAPTGTPVPQAVAP